MSADRETCPACDTPRKPDDQFCKHCGAAVVPPPKCPACAKELPPESRFCPGCGVRVIGERPGRAPAPPAEPPIAAREIVDDLRKKAPSRVTGIVSNVLLFVGVLLVFVVFMRSWNEGKAKEGNMFGGGASAALPASKLASPPPGDAPPAGAAGHVEGTIALAPGASAEGTVFVIVRPAGSPERGPPLAVRRIEPTFPIEFSVGAENEMIQGQPFTGPFDVYVRLDRDGNAMTKDPADLTAGPFSGVMPGGPSIAVTLGGAAGAPASAAATHPAAAIDPSPGGAGSGPIEGRIVVEAALGSAEGTALYVIVRPAGGPDRGPPVAVRKYDHPTFPLAFTVGPDDMMMEGSSFNGPFDVWARLDGDGDAATREPGDLETSKPAAHVAAGARGVALTLDRKR